LDLIQPVPRNHVMKSVSQKEDSNLLRNLNLDRYLSLDQNLDQTHPAKEASQREACQNLQRGPTPTTIFHNHSDKTGLSKPISSLKMCMPPIDMALKMIFPFQIQIATLQEKIG